MSRKQLVNEATLQAKVVSWVNDSKIDHSNPSNVSHFTYFGEVTHFTYFGEEEGRRIQPLKLFLLFRFSFVR